MTHMVALAEANQRKAREVIAKLRVVEAWEAVGAEAHLVGSLRTGLLMKHRDISYLFLSFQALRQFCRDGCAGCRSCREKV